jgi:glycosyltransferase involved in cell wall biosynthesis
VGGYCARRADAIVCISQAVADVVRPLAPDPSQVRVIHNGIDADAFAAAARGGSIRTEFRWPPSAFVAAMIAQFVPWKRHHDFLDALARAVRSAPGLRGIVAGDDLFGDHPDLGRQLREAAYDLGLSDRVVFTGRRSDVPDLIAASNVVVIASEAEPFGRVALEAMAFGKPVVGTSAGGLPEVVGHEETGLLVPPRRPDAIAEALLRLVQDPALAERLGRCGHARVRERFALAEAVRRTEALYDEIAAAPPEGGR